MVASRGRLAAACCTFTAALIAAGSAQAATGDVKIEVLSNRRTWSRVRTRRSRSRARRTRRAARVTADVDGRDVTSAFTDSGGGRIVAGPRPAHGPNQLTAKLADRAARAITITNHPIGGRCLRQAGPAVGLQHPEPAGQQRHEPDGRPRGPRTPARRRVQHGPAVSYVYKNAVTGQFEKYDPDNPPADSQVAKTTTDQGKTVRYVVRQEFGVQDRGIDAIAKLADDGGWNHKLLTYFGASHRPGAPAVPALGRARRHGALARVHDRESSLNVHGNTNENVSAEALMMLQEHIVETYGSIRYTIGQGCSGGVLPVHDRLDVPGLLNGIQPTCSYTDLWTTAPDVLDCGCWRTTSRRTPTSRGCPRSTVTGTRATAPPGTPSSTTCRTRGRARLQAPRRPGLRSGGQAASRPLQHPGLPRGDLGSPAEGRVGVGGEADRQGVRQPAVGQRGRAVRPEGPRVG